MGIFCILFFLLFWGNFFECWEFLCVCEVGVFLVFIKGFLLMLEILGMLWLFESEGWSEFVIVGWMVCVVLGEIVCCFVNVVIVLVRFIVVVFCLLECWC